MGNSESYEDCIELPQRLPPPDQRFPYFTLTFRTPNIVKLVMAPQHVVDLLIRISNSVYSEGLENVEETPEGCLTLIYIGAPFAGDSVHEESVFAAQLATRMIKALYTDGWDVLASSVVARFDDRTTWFFQRVCPERPEPNMFCVSLRIPGSLQLIDCPSYIKVALENAINADEYGPQMDGSMSFTETIHELEFDGNLWTTNRLEVGIVARQLLLTLFRATSTLGYQLHTTANLNDTSDTLFFIRPADDRPAKDETFPAEKLCMISMNCDDTLRLIGCPQPTVAAVGRTIHEAWAEIQVEGILNVPAPPETPAYGFQLEGEPWSSGGPDAISVRKLLMQIFEAMLSVGWSLVGAFDISARINDKSVFVFRQCQPAAAAHMCISLMDEGGLDLIGGNSAVLRSLRRAVQSAWAPRCEKRYDLDQGCSLNLYRKPWVDNSDFGRVFLLHLLNEFSVSGWRVVASADVSTRHYIPSEKRRRYEREYKYDPHSWFLVYVGADRGGDDGEPN